MPSSHFVSQMAFPNHLPKHPWRFKMPVFVFVINLITIINGMNKSLPSLAQEANLSAPCEIQDYITKLCWNKML
mgnify:CR=1 FL=1